MLLSPGSCKAKPIVFVSLGEIDTDVVSIEQKHP